MGISAQQPGPVGGEAVTWVLPQSSLLLHIQQRCTFRSPAILAGQHPKSVLTPLTQGSATVPQPWGVRGPPRGLTLPVVTQGAKTFVMN